LPDSCHPRATRCWRRPLSSASQVGHAASARSSTILARPFTDSGRHHVVEDRPGWDVPHNGTVDHVPTSPHHTRQDSVEGEQYPINSLAQIMPSAGRTRSRRHSYGHQGQPVRS
jgi:hypothetical protein